MGSVRNQLSDSAILLRRIGIRKSTFDYRNKESIFAQGDAADSLFCIEHGNVKLTVKSRSGKKVVLGILRSGDFFGEGCLLQGNLRTSTATSLHVSAIASVKRATFARLIREDSAFSNHFVAYMVSRVGRIEEDYADQVLNPSEKRLARILWSLTGGAGRNLDAPLKVSQGTLAEMIGTTRSRVSYFMNRFRKMGLINYNGSVHAYPSLHAFLLHGHAKR